MRAAPRLFGIPASDARIVAIIRRGPSEWTHVGSWDLNTDTYTPGGWLRGVIYPQKCDLSPDGRWFVYSALKPGAKWDAGEVYEAVSRLPWLHALAAWGSGTTYTRGMHFAEAGDDPGLPSVGDAGPAVARFGLAWSRSVQFAVERRGGWEESVDTPPREAGGPWDEKRAVTMTKSHGARSLTVSGRYAAFRTGDPEDGPAVYTLADDVAERTLDAQWAEWDSSGDVVIATPGGRLQRLGVSGNVKDVADLSAMSPDPQPPPAWARDW